MFLLYYYYVWYYLKQVHIGLYNSFYELSIICQETSWQEKDFTERGNKFPAHLMRHLLRLTKTSQGQRKMDEVTLIYGLEFKARALTSQQCESDIIRFMVGTQSLKLNQNQVHIIEVNEDNRSLNTKICSHSCGEVWHLSASPNDAEIISTSYNTLTEDNVCVMRSAIWRIENEALKLRVLLPTEQHGQEIRQMFFHTSEGNKALSIIDNHFVIWDIGEAEAKTLSKGTLVGKGQPKFTCGKWNPHHNVTQVVTSNDCNVKGWDIRTTSQCWSVDNAHSQLVRDLDFNPNRQYYLATAGDDGHTKFWDIRNTTEPVISRSDHSHWVWSVRYNHFHDQLVLTSSSDSRVILICVAGISSEPGGHMITDDISESSRDNKLEEGVLATYEEHEDSVYAVEWSTADPWIFASLSYDGRLLINHVPKSHKYKILL